MAYELQREQSADREREKSRRGREIGPLPPVAQPARRDAAGQSLRVFLETYFPEAFQLAWSADHLRVIEQLQTAIVSGGLFAFAMPRGAGKTTISIRAVEWALLYGHHQFVALIGATEAHAVELLDAIRTDLETNDLLLADFPEVCYVIRKLEGIRQRRLLLTGEPVRLTLGQKMIVLPDVAGSPSAGNCVRVAGLTGRIRGMTHTRHDGTPVRPSCVILDDPQTDESAGSVDQTAKRERIIRQSVLGLAGPGVPIAVVMPCTIICRDDLAARFLDRERNPQWHGTRTQMLYGWPTHWPIWEQYFKLRVECLRAEEPINRINEFYAARRAEMDAGVEAAWPARHEPNELSAIQHALHKLQDLGEPAFKAEYQNDPIVAQEASATLNAGLLSLRLNRVPSGTVPEEATHVTAFCDVHGELLYWMVVAWWAGFNGALVQCGVYPEQRKSYFLLRDASPTLQQAAPGAGIEGSIFAGLTAVAGLLCGREWRRPDGTSLRVARMLVDANWGPHTDLVYKWCRQTEYAGVIAPSHGKGISAAGKPMSSWERRPGEQHGPGWVYGYGKQSRSIRHVIFDTNLWKSHVAGRLTTAPGDRGALLLPGDSPDAHRLLCDHLTSEFRVATAGRERQLEEWRLNPGRDNHWWDCLVGNAVAASMCGITIAEAAPLPKKKKWTQDDVNKRYGGR